VLDTAIQISSHPNLVIMLFPNDREEGLEVQAEKRSRKPKAKSATPATPASPWEALLGPTEKEEGK
jgi:hypothetical protein